FRRRAAWDALDSRAGSADSAPPPCRYSRPGFYAGGPSRQSRAGGGRVLECRSGRALDGQTRLTRGVENSGAPAGRYRREPDPPGLARRVSAAVDRTVQTPHGDDLANLHRSNQPGVRIPIPNGRRWQYADARKARSPSVRRFYRRAEIANSTQPR